MDHINSYPREKLGGMTPYMLALEKYGPDMLRALRLKFVEPDTVNLTPSLLKYSNKCNQYFVNRCQNRNFTKHVLILWNLLLQVSVWQMTLLKLFIVILKDSRLHRTDLKNRFYLFKFIISHSILSK